MSSAHYGMLSRTHVAVLIAIAFALFCARIDASRTFGFASRAPEHYVLSSAFTNAGTGATFHGNLSSPLRKLVFPILFLILLTPMLPVFEIRVRSVCPRIFRRTFEHPVLRWGLAAGAEGIPPDGFCGLASAN